MKLKRISAYALSCMMEKKEMVIFGAGKIVDKVFREYNAYHFEKHVNYIIDNNHELWGTVKIIGDKRIPICSVQYLREHTDKRMIIVIMIKKYEAVVRQISGYSELKHTPVFLYPECHYFFESCFDWLFSRLPLRNMIMFQGRGSNNIENALALCEYMQEKNLLKKYKIVWVCEHPEDFSRSSNNVYIERNIYAGVPDLLDIWRDKYYHYAAHYLFYENKLLFKKRKEQVSVYLKHGTFMLKNVKGKLNIPFDADGAICTSRNYAELAAEQESISREKLIICGSPRLDFLYKEKNVLKTLKLWVPKKTYILWLPTLRQAKGGRRNDMKKIAPLGIPLIKLEREFEVLDNRLSDMNVILIIKPHPHQDLSVYKIGNYKSIVFITQEMLDQYDFTVHSLMRETDALISDYSSIAFDYMLLDRPIAYTVDDIEDYLMGFSVENPFDFMPGEKLYTCDDMLQFIDNVLNGTDLYAEQRRKIRDYVHEYQDDKNCERFLQIMGIC